MTKRTYIKRHPLCQECGNAAEQVHHILPKSLGGDDTENNYISLCKKCHENKHYGKYSMSTLTKVGLAKARAKQCTALISLEEVLKKIEEEEIHTVSEVVDILLEAKVHKYI